MISDSDYTEVENFSKWLAVGSINTSGISKLEEIKKNTDRRGLKLVLANPGSEVMKKLDKSKTIENIGQDWIFLKVEAVGACSFLLHSHKGQSAIEPAVAAEESM